MTNLSDIMEILGPDDKWVSVTKDVYRQLATDVALLESYVKCPTPPIKKETHNYGLFNRGESIEYDTRCPIYLRQMEAFLNRPLGHTTLQIIGPYGPVEIRIHE